MLIKSNKTKYSFCLITFNEQMKIGQIKMICVISLFVIKQLKMFCVIKPVFTADLAQNDVILFFSKLCIHMVFNVNYTDFISIFTFFFRSSFLLRAMMAIFFVFFLILLILSFSFAFSCSFL